MKNMETILEAFGITVPEEKKSQFYKEVAANYKTIADYEKQTGKVADLTVRLQDATDGLKAFEGIDVGELQGKIAALQEQLTAQEKSYAQKLSDVEFDAALKQAVAAVGGRNLTAISSLLDVDALKKGENRQNAIEDALAALKEEHGYLFESPAAPPPYAKGTGSQVGQSKQAPTSLAGALRERFTQERK